MPYGPGAFDDFQLEPAPTFIFSVPLQPEVDLNELPGYYVLTLKNPAVGEAEIDQALKQLQLRAVEILDDCS